MLSTGEWCLRLALRYAEKKSRIITRADSVYIYDADDNKILDGMSGLWCVNVGYGRDELVDAAEKQLRELPYYNSFFNCAHPPSIELSHILQEVTQPQFNRAFYTGSGSESIDTMIRMVRRYWELMDQPDRQIIIARDNAYHGSTIGGTSLGGMKAQRSQGGMLVPGIEHIQQPYWFDSGRELSPEEFGLQAARSLEQKIEEVGADKVAAFVAEPVQGAGGVIIPPQPARARTANELRVAREAFIVRPPSCKSSPLAGGVDATIAASKKYSLVSAGDLQNLTNRPFA